MKRNVSRLGQSGTNFHFVAWKRQTDIIAVMHTAGFAHRLSIITPALFCRLLSYDGEQRYWMLEPRHAVPTCEGLDFSTVLCGNTRTDCADTEERINGVCVEVRYRRNQKKTERAARIAGVPSFMTIFRTRVVVRRR